MPEKNSYRPEELLYHMGHSTRAMNAFFSMNEEERSAILNGIAVQSTPEQAELQMEKEFSRLEALGEDYDFRAKIKTTSKLVVCSDPRGVSTC